MADLKKRVMVVLCVDDDTCHLDGLAFMIETEGHKALKAKCYEEAVEILNREKNIDILLTDYKMETLTGIDLCEYTQKHFPDIKKVIVTSMQNVLDMYDEFKKMDALVMKVDTLQEHISEIIHDKLARDILREKDASGNAG